jgi:hypothetical protein
MVVGNSWFAVARSIRNTPSMVLFAGRLGADILRGDGYNIELIASPQPYLGSSNRTDELGVAAAESTKHPLTRNGI